MSYYVDGLRMLQLLCRLPRGVCRISQGGGGNFKISVLSDIHAAKHRAFGRGVWAHAPQENFYKWCNFVCFEGYFQPLVHFHGKKSSQKIINKHEFFH